jgi:agmatinase
MSDFQIPSTNSGARIALVGFPFDENSSFLRGAALAPPVIRETLFSDARNLWTENGIDLGDGPALFDAGNLGRFSEIERDLAELLKTSVTPICLGGDHSITYPILRALHRKFTDGMAILHFDAHPDLYHDFQGNRYSHASPFARILEDQLADRLVQVGIRAMTGHQREQANRFGVEVVEMKDWTEDRMFLFDDPVYISIDMDALDPAFAPGVSHPEPAGLSTRQVIRVIQNLQAQIAGADIVEFNPTRDVAGITAVACAKLVKEIAARMLLGV